MSSVTSDQHFLLIFSFDTYFTKTYLAHNRYNFVAVLEFTILVSFDAQSLMHVMLYTSKLFSSLESYSFHHKIFFYWMHISKVLKWNKPQSSPTHTGTQHIFSFSATRRAQMSKLSVSEAVHLLVSSYCQFHPAFWFLQTRTRGSGRKPFSAGACSSLQHVHSMH